MKRIAEMTAEEAYSEETMDEVFSDGDEIRRERTLAALRDVAKGAGKVANFDRVAAAFRRERRALDREARARKAVPIDNMTEFTGDYPPMRCGSWVAQDGGIWAQDKGNLDVQACYHPILPIERLKNIDTGEEQLKIAFKRNGRWEEFIVPKTAVTSANRIVALSGRGVAVTSENAKYLVRYLADVENMNEDAIGLQLSSSRLGWVRGGFLPYDTEIRFDGDSRFRQLFDSIRSEGSRSEWVRHVREIRASGRLEPRLMMAASFGSALVGPCGALPFVVDLWGETEGGKTVTLMLAASVWADPAESRYVGDFKSTDVALEARAGMLCDLPVILDDTSKTSQRVRDNFEGVVYDLCSGKGKSRSNKEIGLSAENRWHCAILTSGERPLTSYVTQGGAINRVLEVECGQDVFGDPHATAELVKANFGHAGPEFVRAVKEMGEGRVREIQEGYLAALSSDEKMEKQALAVSVMLAADRIATDEIFRDGMYITAEEARGVLVDRAELSDSERCYQYVLSEIDINRAKFDPASPTVEKWGEVSGGYAVIYNNAFDAMMARGGFSRKGFLNWAKRKGLLQYTGNDLTKARRVGGRTARCVVLRVDGAQGGQEPGADPDGFLGAGEFPDGLPF